MRFRKVGDSLARYDFFFSVIAPLFIYGLFVSEGRGVFVYPELTLAFVASLAVTSLLLFLALPFLSVVFRRVAAVAYLVVPRIKGIYFDLFATIYFVFSLFYFYSGLNYIRYGGVAAAEQLENTSIAAAIFVFKTAVCAQIFYLILMGVGRRVCSKYYWALVSISLIFSADGMAHIALLGVFFWFLFKRNSLERFIGSPITRRVGVKLFFVFGVFVVFFFGIVFKSKSIESISSVFSALELISNNLLWLMDRGATLYFSAGYAVNNSGLDFGLQVESWMIAINEISYRFCVLFSGGGCSDFKVGFGSISRFNFSNISVVDPGRGGASSGVFGSAVYLFSPYLAPVMTVIYYAVVAALIDAASGRRARIRVTFAGSLVLLYLVRIMYLSPAAMINPISSPFIGALVFFVMSAQFSKINRGVADHE